MAAAYQKPSLIELACHDYGYWWARVHYANGTAHWPNESLVRLLEVVQYVHPDAPLKVRAWADLDEPPAVEHVQVERVGKGCATAGSMRGLRGHGKGVTHEYAEAMQL